MSRIGKKPVQAPNGAEFKVSGQTVQCKGPKGVRTFTATDDVDIVVEGNTVTVKPRGTSKRARQQWGMTRTQIANLATGVTTGFTKQLDIQGVGYRAQIQGRTLKLALGYSHDVDFAIPDGIDVVCPKPTEIVLSGIDQQLVGETAAKIRDWRRPEPYKGKGIRYRGEFIFRKEGKKK
ncbi:MAG: 50S ribosomal protein L6 [Thermohalobaculum sp.]|nr:50S ribosomal protein L6 [Thermohalobaculum sp.]